MSFLQRARRVAVLFMLVLVTVTTASCTPDASAEIISPELGTRLAAQEAGTMVEVAPTPEPMLIANMSQEQILAGLPEEVAAAVVNADPAQGQQLTVENACIGCHAVEQDQVTTGPTWYQVGDTAANRLEGVGPALYLYQSITEPNAHVVEGYLAGIMPQNYEELLTTDQLGALVSYLLAQHE